MELGRVLVKAKFTVIRAEWGSRPRIPRPRRTSGPAWVALTDRPRLLTHGLQLPDELLLGPFHPLLLVGVDGAEDGPAGLAAVLDGRDVQVVHQDDVGVLGGRAQTLVA